MITATKIQNRRF